jgi:ribosomal protein S18 acetylase RimI-like enzyme
MGVSIRRARAEEYAEIGAVTIAAYEPFLVGAEDGYRERLLDVGARDREAEVWVATPDDSDEILGNVTVCPEGSPWRELAKDDEGEFRMLAVSPTAQGRGVGRALTEFVLDRFRSEGATGMVLSSLPGMGAAHGIYERLGFTRDPALDWHPMPDVDLIAYRLEF